jgi:hypothetical protein
MNMRIKLVGALGVSSFLAMVGFGCNHPDSAPGKDLPGKGVAPAQAHGQQGAVTATGGHTAVPTLAEWSAVGEVNVRNSGSLGCETKMVREWLRISCHTASGSDNAVTGVQAIRPTGDKEYLVFQAANLASLVMPVRDGTSALARFTWQKWGSRDLTVSWPHGAPSASMSFDRGGDPSPSTAGSAAAGALACKAPADCPKGHCCLNGSSSSCSATTCAVGAEICMTSEDCEQSTLKGTGCKKASNGLFTCQR